MENTRGLPEDSGEAEIAEYHRLLLEDPRSRVFGRLAEAYARQGRFAEAIAVCAQGLQHHPDFLGARLILARALAEHGDLLRAESEFRRVLALTPDNVPAHRALGDLLRAQGKVTEALVVYRELLDLAPLDREVREVVQDLSAGAVAQQKAVPGLPEPPPALAGALRPVKIPEGEGPVPTYDLTAEAEAGMALPLGSATGSPGEHAKAVAPPLATETLADLYVQQGFLEEAREIYEEIVRVDPSRADIRAKLALFDTPRPSAGAPAETEPAPVEVPGTAPANVADDGDAVLRALEGWLGAARSLRAERRPQ